MPQWTSVNLKLPQNYGLSQGRSKFLKYLIYMYVFVRVGAKKYLKCLKVPQRNVIGAGWSEGRKESSQRSADQKGQGGGGLLFCKTATIMNDFQITEGFRYSTRFADQEGQGGGGHAAEG